MTLPPCKSRRLGLFGGAFDPPHLAHQALAQHALDALQLDLLHVIPTGLAWHKQRPLSAPAHRLAMTQLAFDGWPKVCVNALETTRVGPSYTLDTLHQIGSCDAQAELFLVLGEDQAQTFQSWHGWQEILEIAIICVAFRDDIKGAYTEFQAKKLFPTRFRQLSLPAMALSATDIRAKIAARQNISALVCEPVARYIATHHLYQTD